MANNQSQSEPFFININDVYFDPFCNRKVPMSFEDEDELWKFLDDNASQLDPKHKEIHQFRRKLEIRRNKRAKGSKIHSLDRREVDSLNIRDVIKPRTSPEKKLQDNVPRILDRYQVVLSGPGTDNLKGCSFQTRLFGRDHQELKPIKSPFTGRMLKPFIRRDYKTEPLKVKLLREILQKTNPDVIPERHPIDYMYVRPNHIPSVNHLAREFFWPGIDREFKVVVVEHLFKSLISVSECLQFPDFSCVAVYRKIVVGFAFLVPDVSYVEAYVSFVFTHPEWRNVGIAKFMLYHLIQVQIKM